MATPIIETDREKRARQQQAQQPQRVEQPAIPAKIVTETESTMRGSAPELATMNAYDPNTYKQSQSLTELINLGKQKRADYEKRYNQSVKNTKALAWGNLLTQLGKLAGWGNAPVVKEENQPLMKAFADSDRLRDMYQNIQDSYDTAIINQRAKEYTADQAQHYANEKARVDAYNKAAMDIWKENKVNQKQRVEIDPYVKQELAIKQQQANAATRRAEAQEGLSKARADYYNRGGSGAGKQEAYATHTGRDGKRYNISRSDAIDVIQRVIDDYKEQKKDYVKDLDRNVWVKLQSVINNPESNDNMIRARAKQYLNKYEDEFRDILNNAANYNNPANNYNSASSESTNNTGVKKVNWINE